jgi:hypothetical protein
MVDVVAIQQNVRALGNLQKKNSSASTRAKGLGPPEKNNHVKKWRVFNKMLMSTL